jgi:FixJ family two-component response regulator
MMMADTQSNAVAIVDDDVALLDALKFLLEITGHKVVAYSSATAFLQDRAARPTCLILDQHMPQMTGLELAAHLRDEGIDIPVLLITAQPSPAVTARAAQLGIARVLRKPLAEDDLLSFVNTYENMISN